MSPSRRNIVYTCRRFNGEHHVLRVLRELRRAFHAFENFQRYRPHLDLLADRRHDFLTAESFVLNFVFYLSTSEVPLHLPAPRDTACSLYLF